MAYTTGYPMPAHAAYPDKGSYADEAEWMRAMVLWFAARNADGMRRVQEVQRESVEMYNRTGRMQAPKPDPQDLGGAAAQSTLYSVHNQLFPIVRRQVGERASALPDVRVEAVNAEAATRLEGTRRMMELVAFLRAEFGEGFFRAFQALAPDPSAADGPVYDGDLDAYLAENYRDEYASAAEALLAEWMERKGFLAWLNEQTLMYYLTGAAYFVPQVDPETFELDITRVPPYAVMYDMECRDDQLRDASFFITLSYEPMVEILKRYPRFSREEVARLAGPTGHGRWMGSIPVLQDGHSAGPHARALQTKVLVVRAQFVHNEPFTFEHEVDELTVEVDEAAGVAVLGTETTRRSARIAGFQQLYGVVLLGGELVAEAGRGRHQVRRADFTGIRDACPDFVGLKLDQCLSPHSPTIPQRIKGYQSMIDMLLTQIAEMALKMDGGILMIDVDAIPSMVGPKADTSGQQVIEAITQMLKEKVVLFSGSKLAEGSPDGRGREMPVTVTGATQANNHLTGLLSVVQYYIQEVRTLLTWNDARVGNLSPYASNVNIQMQLSASDYATAYMDAAFDLWARRVLEYVANKLKVLLRAKVKMLEAKGLPPLEHLGYRLSDRHAALLAGMENLLQDYSVDVHFSRNQKQLEAQLQGLVQIGLQQGELDAATAMDVLMARNPQEGLARVKRALRLRRAERQAQQGQAAAQAAAEAAARADAEQGRAAAQAAAHAAKADAARTAASARVEAERVRADAGLAKAAMAAAPPEWDPPTLPR